MDKKRTTAYFALITTSIIWGIAAPVIKYTLQFVQPFSFLFWRFLITSLVFLPIFFVYIKRKRIRLTLKKIIKLSALGFLGTTFSLSLLFVGFSYTTAIDGSLIYSIAPILVVIGGAFFLKEIVTGKEKFGTLLAFLGSIVIVIQPILEGGAFASKNSYGNILVLMSAITWAAYCLLVRQFEFKEKTDPLILTAISFFAGFITIIPFFFWEQSMNHQPLAISHPAIPGILYMSLLSSVIAYFTYNLGYSLIEASEAVIFDYLKPLIATPVAMVWLGEKVTLTFLLGASIIALGVVLTEYKPRRLAPAKEK